MNENEINAKGPGRRSPRAFRCYVLRGLWDGLETVVRQAQRVGLEERNTGAHKLSDEVVTVASDPNVSCLIDSQSAASVEVGGGFLESCSG